MHVIGLLSVPNDALDSSCLSLSYLLACSTQDTTGIGFLVLKKVDFYSGHRKADSLEENQE
jgi:hypothetical protein